MKNVRLAALITLTLAATAAWKIRHDVQEEQAGLLARARISAEVALETALSSLPSTGRVRESEIEEENGRLIYAFDIDVPGQGTFDVEVDAMTGELLQSELENEDAGDDDDDGDDGGA
jgi:uncharacterized membrane protein YkoI